MTGEAVRGNGREFVAGVFPVDKPRGMTSFGVVRRVRYLLGIKKVGHAGTLDPFATGVLILCAGRPATRHIDRFMSGRKEYRALLQLGVETETQDPEGRITARAPVPALSGAEIEACLAEFVGTRMQAPPPYSAAKYKGKPLYHYARQGIVISKEPRPVQIHRIDCLGYDPVLARLDITVSCSRGTYIRVLAAEIGARLGCGAHLLELRRTASGCFSVEQCVDGELLFAENGLEHLLSGMIPVEEAVEKC